MSPETLTAYLQRHIPLTAAMRLSAEVVSNERIVLRCPLAPNVNHHQTAFGGSLAAGLMLAGWSMVRVRMGNAGLIGDAGQEWRHEALSDDSSMRKIDDSKVRLVVSKSSTDFVLPVSGDYTVECRFNDEVLWNRFLSRFQSNHWAKLRLQSNVVINKVAHARWKGTFVAINGGGPAEHLEG